jgi:hypothetical protein
MNGTSGLFMSDEEPSLRPGAACKARTRLRFAP